MMPGPQAGLLVWILWSRRRTGRWPTHEEMVGAFGDDAITSLRELDKAAVLAADDVGIFDVYVSAHAANRAMKGGEL